MATASSTTVFSSLVILTRNEISGLTAMLRHIPRQAVDEVLAVDFNSTDGTAAYFKKHGIPVIHQQKPGRAEAFYLAAKHAKGQVLVFFSPDGNEDPSDIPRLLAALKAGADMVIASRFLPSSRNEEDDQVVKFRKWANQLFSLAANLFFRQRTQPYVTDTINGYRAITRKAFQRLKLDATGYAVEYQMTIRALKLGLTITEIPTQEGNRIGGQSGAKAIPTGLQFLGYLWREVMLGRRSR